MRFRTSRNTGEKHRLMIKISTVQQASDRCIDIINILKFIMRSNAGFTDVLSLLLLGIQILKAGFCIAS
jgi:hypothetical protein